MTTEATEARVSTRGLVEGGYEQSPLRRFRGKFAGYTTAPATGYAGTRVTLNFTEVDVLQSVAPYNFPTAQLETGLSNRKKSKWGYFSDSLNALMDEEEDIQDQEGKLMEMVFCDGLDERPAPRPIFSAKADIEEYPDRMVPTPYWAVAELEGVVAGAEKQTPAGRAEELLDGKTLAEFNKAAYADPLVKTDVELQRAITDKSFVKSMLSAGTFTKGPDNVYHKVRGNNPG